MKPFLLVLTYLKFKENYKIMRCPFFSIVTCCDLVLCRAHSCALFYAKQHLHRLPVGAVIQDLFSSACGACGLFLQGMAEDKHHREKELDNTGVRLPAGGRPGS